MGARPARRRSVAVLLSPLGNSGEGRLPRPGASRRKHRGSPGRGRVGQRVLQRLPPSRLADLHPPRGPSHPADLPVPPVEVRDRRRTPARGARHARGWRFPTRGVGASSCPGRRVVRICLRLPRRPRARADLDAPRPVGAGVASRRAGAHEGCMHQNVRDPCELEGTCSRTPSSVTTVRPAIPSSA